MNQSKRLGEETELATPVELLPGSAIPNTRRTSRLSGPMFLSPF